MARPKKLKMCFSKKLLIADYSVLGLLLVLFILLTFTDNDTGNLSMFAVAWVAQVGLSSAAYYWKAKAENVVKMPVLLIESLPKDMREKVDPNQIIESVLNRE